MPNVSDQVQRLIEAHDLNPVLEKRTALRRALNISRPTQWRQEQKLGVQPADCYAGETPQFDTADYLAVMLTRNT